MTKELESLAAQLDVSPDYRVLRRFVPPSRYHEGDGSATAGGVVVDVETTGLDTARDTIIEFCGVPFEFERKSRGGSWRSGTRSHSSRIRAGRSRSR